MDQVEIIIDIPIDKWDRTLSPVILMERMFTERNRNNVEVFYEKLIVAVQNQEDQNQAILTETFQQSRIHYENMDYPSALDLLRRVIQWAGKDSGLLADALLLRATIFAITDRYEQAIIDNELKMKELSANNEQRLEEIAKIIECYLALGCRKKIEDYLVDFKRVYNVLFGTQTKNLNGLKVEKKMSNDDIQGKYKNFQSYVENQMSRMKYHRILPVLRQSVTMQPYRGFNQNLKIKHSSASCSLVAKKNRPMILSNSIIPKGEIVAVEDPYLRQQYGRILHCDSCYDTKSILLPCFDCHFKNYCSYDCKTKDKRWHDMECIGYKSLILPMLKCELLYRVLMQCLVLLQEHFLYRPQMRKSKTAEELFNNLEEALPTLPYNILDDSDVGYGKFPEFEYTQMVLNSFRLTIFISKYTSILPRFFSDIEASQQEIEIFIAGLILKLSAKIVRSSLQVHAKLDGNEIDSNIEFIDNRNNAVMPRTSEFHSGLNVGSDVFKYYGFDRECMKSQAILRIHDAFKQYWNLDVTLFQNNPNDEVEMNNFIDKDEIVRNLMDVNTKYDDISSVLGLYLTTLKFNYSCDPNLKLIYLPSGILLVKASREIRAGEILTISYGCHYKQGDNNTRSMYTKKSNISCLCDYCNGRFNPYFSENILCINCKILVSPNETLCVSCGYDIMKTSMIYNKLISDLEYNVHNSDEDRNRFYNLTLALMVYEEIIPATNHMFVEKLVLLVDFFAKKCFAYEAYFISIEVQSLMDKIYIEMSIDLLYAYNLILHPLYEMLLQYVDNPIGVNGSFIEKVYNQTLIVIESMIEINDFNVLYDPFTCDILNKYRTILNLKVKVYSLLLCDDVYEMIVDNAKMLKNHTNMKPLLNSVVTKNSNLAELINFNSKTGDNWSLDDKCNEKTNMNASSSPQKIESDLKMKQSDSRMAAKITLRNRMKRIYDCRKSRTVALMAEFDAYFLKMIEERTGALNFCLPY